jgi:hypothetical protein
VDTVRTGRHSDVSSAVHQYAAPFAACHRHRPADELVQGPVIKILFPDLDEIDPVNISADTGNQRPAGKLISPRDVVKERAFSGN